MFEKNQISEAIGAFVSDEIANANSDAATKLAAKLRQAVADFREDQAPTFIDCGVPLNAFSCDASWGNGEFRAQVSFVEDDGMTIMYRAGSDDVTVQAIWDGRADDELCRLAGLMLTEGWVAGWSE